MTDADWRTDAGLPRFPRLVPHSFARLIDEADGAARQALARQIEPSLDEDVLAPEETSDPLGEGRYLVTPYLVHQYPNRVLALVTGKCLGHCRYCFRKSFTARSRGFLSEAEQDAIVAYLANTPAVREILVSGGDPLTAPPDSLFAFLEKLRAVRSDLLIRLCTRGPVFAPEKFTAEFVHRLAALQPLWVIPHINHPAELGAAQRDCITALRTAGIPQQSQTVLLRGVNDSPELLAELFHELVCLGVKPGYLFQCDLAPGTASFRVPPEEGMHIWLRLRDMLSGLSLPQYAVDLPGGGGKFPLSVPALSDRVLPNSTDVSLRIQGNDGKVYRYPLTNV